MGRPRRSFVGAVAAFVDQDRNTRRFEQIIGNSPALESVLEQVEQVAPTDSTVLIPGETGTGKELIARAIYNLSARRGVRTRTHKAELRCHSIRSTRKRAFWPRERSFYRGHRAKVRPLRNGPS